MSTTIQIHPASKTDASRGRQVPWNKKNPAALVEDVQWLLASGESTWQIATRLGYRQRASLERALMRAGRDDLAICFARDERYSWRWMR